MRIFAYLWSLPNTVFAVTIGLVLVGRFEIVAGVIEIHGRLVAAALNRLPTPASAMTMGHVVFGQSKDALRITRRHERVHVRQYERWGPFFIPAYVLISAVLYARGRDGYMENPFEIEAYAVHDPRRGV